MTKILSARLLAFSISFLILVASIHGVEAQSISGDDLCGKVGDKCTPEDLKELGKRFMSMFLTIGGALLVVVLAVRVALSWFAMRTQGAEAIKRTGQQAFNALIGFFIVFMVFGGIFLTLLVAFGTQPWAIKMLQLFTGFFVETAYAGGTSTATLLPNPLGSNSLYAIILAGASLILRFFVYPAVIAMWVWSGFQFVYSQGNPEGLKKAKAWVLWAFVITIIMFSLQGFLVAFKGTAQNIVPVTAPTPSPSPSPSPTPAPGPAPGTYGAVCQSGGFYGIIGTDGTCQVGGVR